VRFVHCGVTQASSGFQATSVEDHELAATVADQLAVAQRTGGSSDACAPHTQHGGDEFMRDAKLVGVASHQEPTGKARLEEMVVDDRSERTFCLPKMNTAST
jgi:hypothetical protein